MTVSPFAELARRAVDTGQPFANLLNQYAMEGLLRRLGGIPEGQRMVLRGSLLTRLWARPAYRPALDVDLVTTYAFDPERASAAIAAACSVAGDGLCFHKSAIRSELTWTETPFPGSRFRVPVTMGAQEVILQVDVGYDDPLVPPPVWVDYPATLGPSVRVLACRPELGCAWKVQGLFEFKHWRAKDLHDIDLIARHTPLDRPVLTEAVRVAFESRGTPLAEAGRLFRGGFGSSRGSRLKWRKFRHERSDPTIPADHLEVVAFVAHFLRPIFGDLGVNDEVLPPEASSDDNKDIINRIK